MNCPICGSKIPYTLQMHMIAAHGPNGPLEDLPTPPIIATKPKRKHGGHAHRGGGKRRGR